MSDSIGAEPPSREACAALLDQVPEAPVDEQLAILEQVIRQPDPALRRRALGLGAALLSDNRLVDLVRDEADDVRRNAGLSMMKMRRSRARRLAIGLLEDDDADVVMQAVQVLGHLADLRAVEPLRRALRHPDTNVVQEVVLALGRIGHPRVLRDLAPLLDAEPWVAVAAIEAVGQLAGAAAVPHLAKRFDEPALAPFIWEAVAQIGGHEAFVTLAERWMVAPDEMGDEHAIGYLVQVLERLGSPPPAVDGLDEALERRAQGPEPLASQAHRCQLLMRGG